ncbi:MAG: hypothetical protein JO005_13625 [Gammaproteobacteria bacterium]|nr:hypothetical protein [Gammaproteobacteria bacterium]
MTAARDATPILVISESLHDLPQAVAELERTGQPVRYVRGLKPWLELAGDDRRALEQAAAVVMGRVLQTDAQALALAPLLRVIALHTSGCDNVDLDDATRRGVLVTTVRGVNAEVCAEFAMALLLAVVRKVVLGDRAIRAGLWTERTHNSLDVHGATLGIVGLGQIAQAFVRRARAFGMRILVHTRSPDATLAQRLGVEYVPLGELLERADVVGLFASLNAQSRHMIGAAELARMKPDAYLINIARGELIDEVALLAALRAGRIAGAGLDVFETEPLHRSAFFELENVVLTPHQAGLTRGAKTAAAVRAVRNALAALEGRLPGDAVNPQAWPRAAQENPT